MGETSGSGQPVYRHTERVSEPEAAFADERLIEEVTAHVERHLGPSPTVNHELISLDVHVDVLHVPPHDGRPCHTLVTCGMSAKPMAAPEPGLERAELLLVLPPEWDASERGDAWPFGMLRFLALSRTSTTPGWASATPCPTATRPSLRRGQRAVRRDARRADARPGRLRRAERRTCRRPSGWTAPASRRRAAGASSAAVASGTAA